MLTLNRTLVLQTLIKHETLIRSDIAKEENLGMIPDNDQLQSILDELNESGFIHLMDGIQLPTYTITEKGIQEAKKWSNKV